MTDRFSGYESVATEFLARRGSNRSTGIGVNQVRNWARTLPQGAAVLDLGCEIQALSGLSFSASNGEITGLLGANGAGKTTAVCGTTSDRRRSCNL